jgi:hypothetical protein
VGQESVVGGPDMGMAGEWPAVHQGMPGPSHQYGMVHDMPDMTFSEDYGLNAASPTVD